MERSPKEQKGQPKGPKSKKRNQAASAVHGNIYQLKLLMLFMYRGVSLGYSFRLGTEIEEADKFDDLVFEYTKDNKKMYRLLQAKHKLDESKKITAHSLFKEKNGDYNFKKYFFSYQSSKKSSMFQDGAIKDVIICTNIDFDIENLKRDQIRVEEIKDKDDILDVVQGGKQPKRYRFSQDLATSDKMDEFPTDEVKDFIDHLVFAVNQPNEETLEIIIKEELGKEFDFDCKTKEDVYNKLFVTMLNWFKDKESDRYFSSEEGKKFFEAAKRGMPIWFGVRDPVESFVGREEQLVNLHRMLQSGDTTVISQAVSISGLGGIGKSELAKMYINEHSRDYDDKVIWINAESYQTFAESFRRLASDKLGMSTKNPNGEEKEMKSIVEDVYNFFLHGKSLFVFDNAEKYRSQDEFDYGIDTFLLSRPPSNRNRPYILITSRNRKWPKNIKALTLDVFTEEEAIEFIKNSLGIQNDAQDGEIQGLSKELQYFPLALQQAVSYIRVQDDKMKNVSSAFKIGNYLEMFRTNAEKLLDYEFSEDSDNEYTKTTYITWNVTLRALKQKENGREASEILNIISYLSPEDIPSELLLNYINDKEILGSAIELLKQYSMITSNHRKIGVHRLVQHVTRNKLRKQNEEEEILKNVLNLFNDNIDSKTLDHAVCAWNYSSAYINLVNKFFYIYQSISNQLIYSSCRYEEARLFGSETLELLKTMPENDLLKHYFISLTEKEIATALEHQAKYDKALELFQKVLSKQSIILNSWDSKVLETKAQIAKMFFKLGRYEEALTRYKDILNIIKNKFGEDHIDPFTVSIKEIILAVSLELCDYNTASRVFQESRPFPKQTVQKNHPQSPNSSESITNAQSTESRYEEASKMYEEILNVQEAIVTKNDPEYLTTKRNLATVLVDQCKFCDALQIYQEVLTAQKATVGEDHPEFLFTYSEIGEVVRLQSKCNEALDIFREILSKQKKILGPDHPDVLITKEQIARTLCESENYNDALKISQEMLNQKREIFGNEHVSILKQRNEIAGIFSKLREYNKAHQLHREILTAQEILLGENHPDTLTTKINIAMVLHDKKDYDKALQICKEVYTKSQNLYPTHLITITSKESMAKVLESQGKTHEALEFYRELLESQEDYFGKEHYYATNTKRNIAITLFGQGKHSEALDILQEVFEGFQRHFGQDHQKTLDIRQLMETLKKLGVCVQLRVVDKGITPLHVATTKGFTEIVKSMLENHPPDIKLNEIIDAGIISDGATSLHIAAENGFFGIVTSLLEHGGTYDIKNRDGKTPLELSRNKDVTNLLKLIAELFKDAKKGKKGIINKLKAIELDVFPAVTNARNLQGHTLLQVAILNKNKDIASKMLELLKKPE